MGIANSIGRKTVAFANSVVNLIVLFLVLLLLVFGCYAIWDSRQVYNEANSIRYERYKPSIESPSFQELQTINPDVFAWLTVYGTHIDYPVVQGSNNTRYVNTNAEGRYSLSGAIFLDYRNKPDFSDFNNIFYGHHMEKQAMFGEIGNFEDRAYFNARKYGMLYYNGVEHGLEFFAFVSTDAYDTSVFRSAIYDPVEQQQFLDMLLEIAINVRWDVPVSTDDRLVMLSTCSSSSTNGRHILIGKIVDVVPEDSFYVEKPVSTLPTIDELPSLWEDTAPWLKACIIFVPILIILLAIILTYTKRRHRNHFED
ncbi:MAG: class B sortase [Eggerthellaceae bacterium]|nr:class B sortase [Eggerthellaceae bacterium]